MITLRTLEHTSTNELLDAFNLAFSDYVIPFCLTKEQLEDKIKSDSINLEFSVGAFENNQLIAFLLHGYDIVDNLKIVYNSGTGVIPTKRGNKLTYTLYKYILPVLQENNIDKVQLEVITSNEAAIKTYTSIGFKITRQFNCFKGSINATTNNSSFEVRKLKAYDWQKLKSFWDFNPSWQNAITAVEKLRKDNVSIGIYQNEQLLAYVIYNPKIKRIHQLSVEKNNRKKGIGKQLLAYISTNYAKEVSCINVDATSIETLKFMTGSGMNNFIKQHEMELKIRN